MPYHQDTDFHNIEVTLEEALSQMSVHYSANKLGTNPTKTQITAFHLHNRNARWELKVHWNDVYLQSVPRPVYLGVALDRTLGLRWPHEIICYRSWQTHTGEQTLTQCAHLHWLCATPQQSKQAPPGVGCAILSKWTQHSIRPVALCLLL